MTTDDDSPTPTGTPPASEAAGPPPAPAAWSAETPPADPPDVEPVEPSNAEAARHRVRAREAEVARDAALGRVAVLQAREVERLAGEELAVPGDLFAVGRAALPDLLDAAGEVDADAVRTAVGQLLAERPGLARPRPFPALGQGRRQPVDDGGPTWSGLLSGRS